jgi:hypothetical protein
MARLNKTIWFIDKLASIIAGTDEFMNTYLDRLNPAEEDSSRIRNSMIETIIMSERVYMCPYTENLMLPSKIKDLNGFYIRHLKDYSRRIIAWRRRADRKLSRLMAFHDGLQISPKTFWLIQCNTIGRKIKYVEYCKDMDVEAQLLLTIEELNAKMKYAEKQRDKHSV